MTPPTELTHMQEAVDNSGFGLMGHHDLYVDADGLVYMTDRGASGLYVLEHTG